jgi:hypothetical protein
VNKTNKGEEVMAESKCPKCDSIKFEAAPAKPEQSPFPLTFVQCRTCGAVIGVLESNNINTRLNEIEKNIITLLAQVNQKLVALQFR